MSEQEPESTRPWACFDRRYLAVVLAMGAGILGVAWLMKRTPPGSIRLGLAALEAALAGGLVLYTVAKIRQLDELGQRIQLQSIAVSFAVSAALITGYSMLTHAGLPPIDFGVWTWPVMAALWAIASVIVQRRYR